MSHTFSAPRASGRTPPIPPRQALAGTRFCNNNSSSDDGSEPFTGMRFSRPFAIWQKSSPWQRSSPARAMLAASAEHRIDTRIPLNRILDMACSSRRGNQPLADHCLSIRLAVDVDSDMRGYALTTAPPPIPLPNGNKARAHENLAFFSFFLVGFTTLACQHQGSGASTELGLI